MATPAKRPRQTFIQASRSASAHSKASWHAVEGAGKRRVVRDFFQLSEQDMTTLTAYLQGRLDQRIARQA